MESYEAVLERMQAAYETASGQPVALVSDSNLRLRVMAGEITRLQAELSWLRTQAFPFTATDEWLDQHGELRGVSRFAAAPAQGTLTFSRYLPLSFDAVLPKGTVCATTGDAPLEFLTTEEVTLPAGSLSVTVAAQAALAGASGNVTAGQISALVTETDLFDYVTNKSAFTDGTDAESDDEYRVRVLQTYREPTTALNSAWYRSAALAQPGIYAAQAVPDESGNITVYCWGKSSAPSSAVLTSLSAAFSQQRDIGVTVTVTAAQKSVYALKMRLRPAPGVDFDLVKKDARQAAKTYFAGVSVGDGVTVSEISRAVMKDPAVLEVEFPSSVRDLAAADGVIPVLSSVTMEEIT